MKIKILSLSIIFLFPFFTASSQIVLRTKNGRQIECQKIRINLEQGEAHCITEQMEMSFSLSGVYEIEISQILSASEYEEMRDKVVNAQKQLVKIENQINTLSQQNSELQKKNTRLSTQLEDTQYKEKEIEIGIREYERQIKTLQKKVERLEYLLSKKQYESTERMKKNESKQNTVSRSYNHEEETFEIPEKIMSFDVTIPWDSSDM